MKVLGRMTGVTEMRNKLREIAVKFPDRVAAAIFQEASIELTESKRRCPVSPTAAQAKAMGRSITKGTVPGTLRASGTVHEPMRSGSNISVTMSYGGAAADYVIPQHERADFQHTTGQAFFLSSVLNESRPYMAGRIAARVHFNKARA